MAAPFNNLRSKLNRSICAWLISQEAGDVTNVLPTNTAVIKTYPVTIVQAVRGTPEPPMSGDYRCQVHVMVKGTELAGANQSAQQSRINFDIQCARVCDALMMTADNSTLLYTAQSITAAGRALAAQDAKNNADMADFTCINWFDEGFGLGDPSAEGCSWVEVFIFSAVCCASNTD
jgi:hypothetical protein